MKAFLRLTLPLASKIGKYRIFIFAIAVSFAWHIFWLSAVKVIVSPSKIKSVKFSKVAFLGPILTRVAMEVRVEPKVHSFLETRYLTSVKNITAYKPEQLKDLEAKGDAGRQFYLPDNEKMAYFIDEAVSGGKLEPTYSAE